jgi:hypothetical protein
MTSYHSVKDFLEHRRGSLLPDPADVTSATTKRNGDIILTLRMQEAPEEETVDTSEFEFAPQALDKLREEDPFLFFSIQKDMRKRSITVEGDCAAGTIVDNADNVFGESQSNSNGDTSIQTDAVTGTSRRTSLPNVAAPNANRPQARRHSTIGTTNVVKRQRRLSTEAHPCLMYESILAGFAGTDSDGPQLVLDNVDEEDLLSLLQYTK